MRIVAKFVSVIFVFCAGFLGGVLFTMNQPGLEPDLAVENFILLTPPWAYLSGMALLLSMSALLRVLSEESDEREPTP